MTLDGRGQRGGSRVGTRSSRPNSTGHKHLRWAISDQILASASNFGLNLLAARSLGAEGFGSFSVAYLCFLLILGITRSIATDPLTVRYSAAPAGDQTTAVRQATGTSLLAGTALGSLLAVAGILVGAPVSGSLLAMGVVLPALLLQDSWRFVFLTTGHPRKAFLNDAVFCLAEAVALGIVLVVGHPGPAILVLGWGSAAAIAALCGAFQTRLMPHPSQARAWFLAHRDLGLRFSTEFAALSGASQLTLWAVAAFGGLGELAVFRVGLLAFGPINTLFSGVELASVPEVVRLASKRGPSGAWRLLVRLSLACALAGITWTAATLLIPASLEREVFGPLWDGARRLLPALGVYVVLYGLSLGPSCGLRALARARTTLRVRAFIAVLAASLGCAGAVLDGATGAATGIALAAAVGCARWWQELRDVVRTSSPA